MAVPVHNPFGLLYNVDWLGKQQNNETYHDITEMDAIVLRIWLVYPPIAFFARIISKIQYGRYEYIGAPGMRRQGWTSDSSCEGTRMNFWLLLYLQSTPVYSLQYASLWCSSLRIMIKWATGRIIVLDLNTHTFPFFWKPSAYNAMVGWMILKMDSQVSQLRGWCVESGA